MLMRPWMLLPLLVAAPPAPPRDLALPPVHGESARVIAAPADLSPAPEAIEVASGLVWAVLADGTPSPRATRVPGGLFITAAGWANLEVSIQREIAALTRERDALRVELAKHREALHRCRRGTLR